MCALYKGAIVLAYAPIASHWAAQVCCPACQWRSYDANNAFGNCNFTFQGHRRKAMQHFEVLYNVFLHIGGAKLFFYI